MNTVNYSLKPITLTGIYFRSWNWFKPLSNYYHICSENFVHKNIMAGIESNGACYTGCDKHRYSWVRNKLPTQPTYFFLIMCQCWLQQPPLPIIEVVLPVLSAYYIAQLQCEVDYTKICVVSFYWLISPV